MKNLWIVTREINQYDQDGEYFVSAFIKRPEFNDLVKLLPNEDKELINRLLNGGGRDGVEDEWYSLRKVVIGEVFGS